MGRVSIWQGAFILALTGLVNRILSFFYRMLVVRLIGAEGIGLYEMVFPFYSMVLVLATAGVPVALSKLTAERVSIQEWASVRSIFKLSLLFLSFSGIFVACVLWKLSPYLTGKVFADNRVYPAFMVMLVALPVVCICSVFRAYFQGLQLMKSVALAQLCEQIVRVSLGLFLGLHFLPYGVEMAAAGLAIGMVGGELVGLTISIFIFWLAQPYYDIAANQKSTMRDDIDPLMRLSFPVMLSRIAGSFVVTMEALLIPHQLQVWGLSVGKATTVYGEYAGIALTLIYLPTVITVAISFTMLPAISEAQAMKNYNLLHKRCSQALKITLFCSLPFVSVFYLFAEPICSIVFGTPEAGIALKALAWGCVFIYLEQTIAGILNGLGAMTTLLLTTVIGGILGLAGIYFLTPILGITGSAIGVNLGCAVTAILDLLALIIYTHFNFDFRTFILWPAISLIAMLLANSLIWQSLAMLPDIYRLIFGVIGGGLLYLIIILGSGIIDFKQIYIFSWSGHRKGK
ncbi:MAG: stage sporulation protein [Clostridia bacterium]|nr:stage sporulation protein [Clostridia bacterium]